MAEAGFDSIEIHLAHNYLLSAFLSPKFNKRKDDWNGSLENRARFARQVVAAVRGAAPAHMAVMIQKARARRGFAELAVMSGSVGRAARRASR